MWAEPCLEPQCQEGQRKHGRREKVRLACLTAAHQKVSEVSSLSVKQTRIGHFKVPQKVSVSLGEVEKSLEMF